MAPNGFLRRALARGRGRDGTQVQSGVPRPLESTAELYITGIAGSHLGSPSISVPSFLSLAPTPSPLDIRQITAARPYRRR